MEFPTENMFTPLAPDEIGGQVRWCFTLQKLMRQFFDMMIFSRFVQKMGNRKKLFVIDDHILYCRWNGYDHFFFMNTLIFDIVELYIYNMI